MKEPSRLQIYAVEAAAESGGICIARCVGGVVRVGQVFTHECPSGASVTDLRLTLDRIERYVGQYVDFFDPPHAARVHFSGTSTSALARGDIITSAPAGGPIESLEG
ncbi:hypothetical protein HRW23_13800 [Streptomyces lunaelactis]|uniref:hypothetical protein n=1 Tax=Streptomyces lunaelactis TaxID=1535768 RepID=UPI001585B98B|nr:hypothetical protein [Streptomyces lunaelactis]NUK04319.1 hypothetical protein [Streptomyces lunaelactis]NUK18768.1 hypothetical protein [Streptomyces lunaelactis]NUK44243.1 hypothetical protein [Streptomyces lunaelactis]NUK78442.1 hypothetical protein [Streptomyces lunaelactis]NUL25881.1 hypothetical protein [Streptomyces lunaelactis]